MWRAFRLFRPARPGCWVAAVVLACVFAGGSERMPLAPEPSKLVQATVSATPADASGAQTLTIVLSVAPAWHIYANPVGNPDLVTAQTEIRCHSGRADLPATISYPPGIVSSNPELRGGRIYEGQVTIPARLRRDRNPVTITIKMTVCNDAKRTCIPQTLTLMLP
jgi:hypothetical protein